MHVIKLEAPPITAYVILGIDENEHDQVLAVCLNFDDAKRYLIAYRCETPFYDLWIEKHSIL